MMNHIFKFFLPQETKFFLLLQDQTDILFESGKVFFNSIIEYNQSTVEERNERQKKIKELEEFGDAISFNIIEQIDKNIITPFDREDIHSLTICIDDILDSIDATFKRIVFCDLNCTDEIILELNQTIFDSIKEINLAVKDLQNLKNIKSHCSRIDMLENQADTLLAKGLVYLFKDIKDPIVLFKTKEIYENMESVTDRCKNFSRHLISIMVKHG